MIKDIQKFGIIIKYKRIIYGHYYQKWLDNLYSLMKRMEHKLINNLEYMLHKNY